jgi:hypothetical protein
MRIPVGSESFICYSLTDRRIAMKAFLTAVLLAIVMAIGSAYTLGAFQQQTDDAFASSSGSVRLPDHGVVRNLVGSDWRPVTE